MITFDQKKKIIKIDTKNTTYAMQISHGRYLLHLYYGKKTDKINPHREKVVSFCPYPEDIGVKFSLVILELR